MIKKLVLTIEKMCSVERQGFSGQKIKIKINIVNVGAI